ncbi:hypothetical protein EES42_43760 [Streptomyces sp. ADI95-17]|nr:hypothetical protein EES42_43760 [Streptomyces sp. ADI95-17]
MPVLPRNPVFGVIVGPVTVVPLAPFGVIVGPVTVVLLVPLTVAVGPVTVVLLVPFDVVGVVDVVVGLVEPGPFGGCFGSRGVVRVPPVSLSSSGGPWSRRCSASAWARFARAVSSCRSFSRRSGRDFLVSSSRLVILPLRSLIFVSRPWILALTLSASGWVSMSFRYRLATSFSCLRATSRSLLSFSRSAGVWARSIFWFRS